MGSKTIELLEPYIYNNGRDELISVYPVFVDKEAIDLPYLIATPYSNFNSNIRLSAWALYRKEKFWYGIDDDTSWTYLICYDDNKSSDKLSYKRLDSWKELRGEIVLKESLVEQYLGHSFQWLYLFQVELISSTIPLDTLMENLQKEII